jgi:hypothetical protein
VFTQPHIDPHLIVPRLKSILQPIWKTDLLRAMTIAFKPESTFPNLPDKDQQKLDALQSAPPFTLEPSICHALTKLEYSGIVFPHFDSKFCFVLFCVCNFLCQLSNSTPQKSETPSLYVVPAQYHHPQPPSATLLTFYKFVSKPNTSFLAFFCTQSLFRNGSELAPFHDGTVARFLGVLQRWSQFGASFTSVNCDSDAESDTNVPLLGSSGVQFRWRVARLLISTLAESQQRHEQNGNIEHSEIEQKDANDAACIDDNELLMQEIEAEFEYLEQEQENMEMIDLNVGILRLVDRRQRLNVLVWKEDVDEEPATEEKKDDEKEAVGDSVGSLVREAGQALICCGVRLKQHLCRCSIEFCVLAALLMQAEMQMNVVIRWSVFFFFLLSFF